MQQYTWIYSLSQPVTPAEREILEQDFAAFLNQWKTHGTPVSGTIELRHGRFVIVQANEVEGRPSGCSIDSLRRAVTEILDRRALPVADASLIFYRDAEGQIQSVKFTELENLIASGSLSPQTIVFDHSLDQSDDLSRWEQPLQATWMKRFLPSEAKSKA